MLTLEEKIGQMMMVGFHGLEPPDYLLEWIRAGRVGGVILFARNIESPAQIAMLTRACHEAAPRPLLIAIDQEGGIVARLRGAFTESPGAMALAAADSESLAEDVSAVLGAEMRALGINWDLAPVLDLTHNIHNPSVGVRSLGVDVERVAALGVAQIQGFQKAGVAATAKHFPGKADTPVDPHVELPVIDQPLDDLWDRDLVPFRRASAAGLASVMITHVQFKALEPDYPSTLSSAIIQGLLRERIGFRGVVSTDCMEMGAITNTYGPAESAVLAALAGADTILFSHTRDYQEAAYQAVLAAAQSGRLPLARIDAAVERITAMKAACAITEPPAPEHIHTPDHAALTLDAARQGTVLLHDDGGLLPLTQEGGQGVVLVEFASYLDSDALEESGLTGFATALQALLPDITHIPLAPGKYDGADLDAVRATAAGANVLIVATRNAHLTPAQQTQAQNILNQNRRSVLLCLRNPYDAGVLDGTGAVLCTCGDAAPSLQAAAEALLGRFTPGGRLPVPLTMD